jgi:O-antigen/teichoic acid export membrane protein
MSLPLGATVSLGALTTSIPRYFIEHTLDEGELGIFAALSYPLIAGSMVIAALAQSATPRLAKLYASRDQQHFRNLILRLMALSAILGGAGVLAVLLFGKTALRLLYGAEYAARSDVFVWVMVDAAIGYSYVFLGTALSAMRRFAVQLPIHLTSVAVLLVLSWQLIGSHGLYGAVAAMIISGVVEAILYVVFIVKAMNASFLARDSSVS